MSRVSRYSVGCYNGFAGRTIGSRSFKFLTDDAIETIKRLYMSNYVDSSEDITGDMISANKEDISEIVNMKTHKNDPTYHKFNKYDDVLASILQYLIASGYIRFMYHYNVPDLGMKVYVNLSVYRPDATPDSSFYSSYYMASFYRFMKDDNVLIYESLIFDKTGILNLPEILVFGKHDKYSERYLKELLSNDSQRYHQIHYDNMKLLAHLSSTTNIMLNRSPVKSKPFDQYEIVLMNKIFERSNMYNDSLICRLCNMYTIDTPSMAELQQRFEYPVLRQTFDDYMISMIINYLSNIDKNIHSNNTHIDLSEREMKYINDNPISDCGHIPFTSPKGRFKKVFEQELISDGFKVNTYVNHKKYELIVQLSQADILQYPSLDEEFWSIQISYELPDGNFNVVRYMIYIEHDIVTGYDKCVPVSYMNFIYHPSNGKLLEAIPDDLLLPADDTIGRFNVVMDILNELEYLYMRPERYRMMRVTDRSNVPKNKVGKRAINEKDYVVYHILKTVSSAKKYIKSNSGSATIDIQYVIPEWDRCGHWRTLANGKQIWIESQRVQRRKPLVDKEIKIKL